MFYIKPLISRGHFYLLSLSKIERYKFVSNCYCGFGNSPSVTRRHCFIYLDIVTQYIKVHYSYIIV